MLRRPRQASRTIHLYFGGTILAPGPIQTSRNADGIVAVLLRWLDDGSLTGLRRLRGNNLYGFDEWGRRLWRVHLAKPAQRPLLLTGFLEDGDPFTLHEANGWWVRVDPLTGLVVKSDFIA